MSNGRVYDLEEGRAYRVRKDFTDCFGSQFTAGTVLTFQRRDYLPYHGGHSIQFAEVTISLQDDDNAELLDNLWDYLEPLP